LKKEKEKRKMIGKKGGEKEEKEKERRKGRRRRWDAFSFGLGVNLGQEGGKERRERRRLHLLHNDSFSLSSILQEPTKRWQIIMRKTNHMLKSGKPEREKRKRKRKRVLVI